MEDLPAILHKLSLRLWSPEYRELDDRLMESADDGTMPIDPLASPLQDPTDWFIGGADDSAVPSFSLDSPETRASFSQKNLLRLAALTDSHRTLSLFTPPIRDAVFRAWAGASERGSTGLQSPMHTLPTLSRMSSYVGSAASTSSVMSDPGSEYPTRPPLSTSNSYTFQNGGSRHGHRQRKAKKRVINLRKQKPADEEHSDAATETTTPEPSVAPSSAPTIIYEEQQEDVTPPRTPGKFPSRRRASSVDTLDITPRASIVHLTIPSRSIPSRPRRSRGVGHHQ